MDNQEWNTFCPSNCPSNVISCAAHFSFHFPHCPQRQHTIAASADFSQVSLPGGCSGANGGMKTGKAWRIERRGKPARLLAVTSRWTLRPPSGKTSGEGNQGEGEGGGGPSRSLGWRLRLAARSQPLQMLSAPLSFADTSRDVLLLSGMFWCLGVSAAGGPTETSLCVHPAAVLQNHAFMIVSHTFGSSALTIHARIPPVEQLDELKLRGVSFIVAGCFVCSATWFFIIGEFPLHKSFCFLLLWCCCSQ